MTSFPAFSIGKPATTAIRVALLAGLLAIPTAAEPDGIGEAFGGAQVDEIIRVRLDRGDLVLESLEAAIKKFDIRDGALLTAVGSVQDCSFHGVISLAESPELKATHVRAPAEILNVNGVIADGEPHFHMTLSNPEGAFGGHIEPGCKVLYRAEFTIAKFKGAPLERKRNAAGVGILQPK